VVLLACKGVEHLPELDFLQCDEDAGDYSEVNAPQILASPWGNLRPLGLVSREHVEPRRPAKRPRQALGLR